MRIKVLGVKGTAAYDNAVHVVVGLGHTLCEDNPDVSIAPLLTRILEDDELNEPKVGTLIFHPSPLPYGRGASAIKWAYKRNEPITAATWFWAAEGVDSGDLCEQEIVKIDYTKRPRDFYEDEIIPAMVRTLKRSLEWIAIGMIRRVPQVKRYASFDLKV